MLTIIKRNGTSEEFSMNKIRNSLAASSDEAKQPLNESDITGMTEKLQAILKDKKDISSQQIEIIVCGLLYTAGFTGIMEQYYGYKKEK